jgi:hypothetical protein
MSNLGHSWTFTVFLLSNSSVDLALYFRLLNCWKVYSFPSVWWKSNWTRFFSRFYLCLAPFRFFVILKNSPVFNDYNHTHNMMQPPIRLKIWRVVWDLPQTLHFIFRIKSELLCQFICSNTLVTFCKQVLFCTGFLIFTLSIRLVLWSYYNVVVPSTVFSYHNSNCFKVTIGLMVKFLSSFFPFQKLSY